MTTPRFLLAAPGSGSGKTTVACAILSALKNRGLNGVSFKCGPDYIDPMFHREALGIPSRNLDLFFAEEKTVRYLLQKNSQGKDFAFIEGVMGYYDGIASTSIASSWNLAKATKTPAILVVNCRGMSVSVVAQIMGYLSYEKDNMIRGVILNQISKSLYPEIKALIEKKTSVCVCGYMPKMSDCSLESRHLGLVTAAEISDLKQRLQRLGEQAEQTIDFELLLKIASEAPSLPKEEIKLPQKAELPLTIGVARDKVFSFYYEDNLDLLRELGANLVFFSPLEDKKLPKDLDGLLIGGGYPEIYAAELDENQEMREQLRKALENGLPCIAECGGFQYLQQSLESQSGNFFEMVGFLRGKSRKTDSLKRFGYVNLTAQQDNILCKKGQSFPAHEFHYWDSEENGDVFAAQKPMRKSHWNCMIARNNFIGGYPHLYFYSNPQIAKNFLNICQKYHEGREEKKDEQ